MEFQHELIIPNEGLPFKLFLFEGRNGNYVREKHWHTSIEIFTVMEGSLFFYIDEVEYPLKAGEFLIINSNEVHSIQAPVRNETIVRTAVYSVSRQKCKAERRRLCSCGIRTIRDG